MQIEQPDESDGKRFVDTSCLCIFRGAFDLLPLWGTMPPGTGPICDRIMWQAIIDRKTPRAHSPEPTVSFRTQYVYHYQVLGEELPPGAKQSKDVAVAAQTFHRLPLTTRVALLEGMPGGEEFVRPGRAQKSGGKTLTLDLTAGSRELAITLPDDSGIRAVVDEIINKKIYTPPAGIGAPRSILDIGANVGIAAAYFRAVYPDAVIHCVEPDPVAYDFLVNNARKIGNCLTYHAGLYNATCLRPFYFGESSVHNSIAAIPGQPTRLLCIDAKNFVSSLSVAKFDLIKIDTEGAELPIMWSLRDVLEQTPVIHLEYHSHRDRRLMDEMLTTSHYLSHGTVDSAHRGQLTYILHDLSRSPAMHEPLS